jgi:hypothetical protein
MNATSWVSLCIGIWCLFMGFVVWRFIRLNYDKFTRHPGWYAYFMFFSTGQIFYIYNEKRWRKWNVYVACIYISIGVVSLIVSLFFALRA